MNHYNILLTIDLEDWFQVENFKKWIPFSSWSSQELRVEKNTHRILDILDSIEFKTPAPFLKNVKFDLPIKDNPGPHENPRATFFVLAWVAERLPDLVREIYSRGHEVASHGYYHRLCNIEPEEDLKKDLINSKKLLEDIIGAQVYGYRAPNFSIDNGVLQLIEKCGYAYDSSFNSFEMNKRYGQIDLGAHEKNGISFKISDTFHELPISNIKLGDFTLPWGGGGYFRLIPFFFFRYGVQTALKKENAYLFYIHPWEIDPDQPKVNEAAFYYRFRHYINIKKTHLKLNSLIKTFSKCRFITCAQYLRKTAHANL